MSIRVLTVLSVLVAAPVITEPVLSPTPFTLRVLDERTGKGVPGLRVMTDNGIVCITLPNGDVSWYEYSLMDRRVHFRIQDDTGQFNTIDKDLQVLRGGRVDLTIHRANNSTS